MKRQSVIRLSEDGYTLRAILARKLGISGDAVIEIALRIMAEREYVVLIGPPAKVHTKK